MFIQNVCHATRLHGVTAQETTILIFAAVDLKSHIIFICSLFNDAFSITKDYIAWNE
jgi:hypothetical protein